MVHTQHQKTRTGADPPNPPNPNPYPHGRETCRVADTTPRTRLRRVRSACAAAQNGVPHVRYERAWCSHGRSRGVATCRQRFTARLATCGNVFVTIRQDTSRNVARCRDMRRLVANSWRLVSRHVVLHFTTLRASAHDVSRTAAQFCQS